MPIIKAIVQNFSVDQGTVNFKIMVKKDGISQKKLKKTYEEFYNLDQILHTKYAKYLKQGIFKKAVLPLKSQYNFNNTISIE